jgi:uncharacterized membrane protein
LEALTFRVEQLTLELHGLRGELGLAEAPEPEEEEQPPPEAAPEEIRPAAPEEAAPPPEAAPEEPELAPEAAPGPWRPARAGAPITAKGLEEALTSRWLVWLGAVAIALGGTFFVKYAVDQGWFGPAIRVTFGFLFGITLALGGEWLRRRPLQRAVAAVRPNYVPPALTAAGVFTAFASIYAAYGLHHLLAPLLAFAGLAAVALVAVGLSLLQGWFVALLGLVGAFLTPALVTSPDLSAWALFGYLLVILVACLAVVRYQAWWWLAFAALAGAAWWPVLWIDVNWNAADALPVGLYLLLTAGAFLFVRHGLARPEGPESWLDEMRATAVPEWIGWAGALAVTALLFLMVQRADHGAASLVFVGLLAALYLFVGRREPVFDGLFVAAAVLTLALMATWQLPPEVTEAPPLFKFGAEERGTLPGAPLVPPELGAFTTALLAFGGLFGVGGFIALWGAKRPAMWAGVSAAAPVLLLAIAYWRIVDFRVDLGWAIVALALAAVSLLAAARVENHRRAEGLSSSLGFYAAAVVAFVSLGVTMTLQQAWLTVALSVQLPALAWIGRRVSVRSIQAIAAIVATVVLVRLVLNYNVLGYPLGTRPLFSWVVYGYGIPAVMFFWAARLFRDKDAGPLVTLLQAGGLAFAVLLVSLQVRVFVAGSLGSLHYGLLEQSLQSAAWFSIGYVLAVHHRESAHPVSFYGSWILLGVAVGQVVLLQLGLSNPVLTRDPVGDYPLVNLLFLAYAVPAAFAFRFAVELRGAASVWPSRGFAALGFVLVFAYLSLEVTRAFQGPVLSLARQSDAEFYAYSLAWLVYAGVLLALGIYRKESALRYASLVVLLVTVVKVFVFDMGDSTGLYRVASFLGLGLSLVGIGYLYQRFVFQRPAAKPPEQEEAVPS